MALSVRPMRRPHSSIGSIGRCIGARRNARAARPNRPAKPCSRPRAAAARDRLSAAAACSVRIPAVPSRHHSPGGVRTQTRLTCRSRMRERSGMKQISVTHPDARSACCCWPRPRCPFIWTKRLHAAVGHGRTSEFSAQTRRQRPRVDVRSASGLSIIRGPAPIPGRVRVRCGAASIGTRRNIGRVEP